MNKAAVVIPIYKQQPSDSEIKSLLQCIKVLNNYPIIFVCPESLNVDEYEKICRLNDFQPLFTRFDDGYFTSLVEYSKLLLEVSFYKKFINFEYILIYQLDAWVFEDRLDYWCNQNFDYIGAPWFEGYDKSDSNSKILPYGGNGGFSLRKVKSIIKILKQVNSFKAKVYPVYSFKQIFQRHKKQRLLHNILNLPLFLIYRFLPQNHWYFYFKNLDIYEDVMFVHVLPKFSRHLKIAPSDIAMYFSFEVQPERLYKMTNEKLPFGCHSYEKYNYEFWQQFIQ